MSVHESGSIEVWDVTDPARPGHLSTASMEWTPLVIDTAPAGNLALGGRHQPDDGDSTGVVMVRSGETGDWTVAPQHRGVADIELSPDRTSLAAASTGGQSDTEPGGVVVYDLTDRLTPAADGRLFVGPEDADADAIQGALAVTWSHDGRILAFAELSDEPNVYLWSFGEQG